MKMFSIGVLVGAIVLYIWGMMAWLALPVHDGTMRALPGEEAVRTVLGLGLEDGVYVLPAHPDMRDDVTDENREQVNKDFEKAHEEGPLAIIFFQKEGAAVMPSPMMLKVFITNLFSVLIAAVLLRCSLHTCRWYIQRVIFVALLGTVVSLMAHVNYWNWMRFPQDHTLAMIIDSSIGWLLVGLVLAAFIKPRKQQRATS